MDTWTSPYMYWVGMDTDPRTTPEALSEFNHFYSTTHVHEVVAAHPGFVRARRYELIEPDARGGEHAGPRWLAVYDMADEAAAVQYVKDNARPWLHRRHYSPWPAARKRAKTVWRMLWQQREARDLASDSITLVGTNEPPSAEAPGVRLELYRAFAHPEPGCPRFCIVSDVESAGADAIWRLVYRRIPLE
jgi:hypothetical protein